MGKTKTKHLKPGRRPVHGGYVFLRSGAILRNNRHIERYLTDLRAGYIKDLGNSLSTGQTVLLNQLITCCGFCRLVEEKARKTKNISYLRIDAYMKFLKHARQLCLDLGLKPERLETLTYLEDVFVDDKEGL